MFQNLPTISRWLIQVSKLAYDFKIIGTMTKLRQVSKSIFATRKFIDRRQVDIIPNFSHDFVFYKSEVTTVLLEVDIDLGLLKK